MSLARPFYKARGSNQWPHILRVVAHAEDIANRVRYTLTAVDYAALYMHDAAKGKEEIYGCEDHGEASAVLTRKALEGRFSPEDLDVVCRAIARHNNKKDVMPLDATENILRSADANRVELGWVMRKSFCKMRSKLRGSRLLDNVFQVAKTRTVASGGLVPPALKWAYFREIEQIRREAEELTTSDVPRMLREAFQRYADEDIDA
jgi:hypothetical protein